jgi:hypothetical protein
MALTALIPALMAESHENGFVIGYGTGVTTGELAALEGTRSVTVAEISHAVIEAAPFFDHGNLAASKNPKVSIRRGDAYRALLQSDEVYDVIISEPSNPWVVGVEMLYSREFLEAARERLAPGGVYAQWFHVYESDPAVVALVLRTFRSVFPHTSVWYTLASDLLLLGFNQVDRAIDVQALEERFARRDFSAGFARVGIESFAQLVAHELVPLRTGQPKEQSGEIHTLRHPLLSYRAARAFFGGRMGSLAPHQSRAEAVVAMQNSLLRRHARRQTPLPERLLEDATSESCRLHRNEHCGTFFALWSLHYPQSETLKQALAASRKERSGASRYLTPKSLTMLKSLLSGAAPEKDRTYSAAEAEHLTGRFKRHYHHVVPFHRDRLDEIWDRCRDVDCEERRIRAESQVGVPPSQFNDKARGAYRREDSERMSRIALSSIVVPSTPAKHRLVAR